MNRVIKFRAWDRHIKRMDYNLDMLTLVEMREMDNLMQFTGLTDKNGKEIYEGDIVEENEYWSDKTPVVWNDNIAGWKCKDWGSLAEYADRVEVIGNIYQNGDLLK